MRYFDWHYLIMASSKFGLIPCEWLACVGETLINLFTSPNLFCRSLSDVYTNKKSLKYLVECFPIATSSSSSMEDSLTIMITLPATTSLGLTREQVMPFLKKMENGQQREGAGFSFFVMLYTYSI